MLKKTLLLSILSFTFTILNAQNLKFGIISDQHFDIMHDSEERLKTFLKASEKEKVDFIIDLGDFAMPKEENKSFLNLWNSSPIEKFNLMGNHDMDNCTKEEYMKFVGMRNRYYSFDKGDYHFIVLDPNNINENGKFIPYEKANYFKYKGRAWIDPEQIEWIKQEVKSTDKRIVVFSHQSLENTCQNGAEVRKIFEDENKRVGYTKIVAAFSGHDHTDYHKAINGITYVQINSAGYQWVGGEYKNTTRYDKEVYERRPAMAYVVSYDKPLFAFVTLSNGVLKMKGKKAKYVAPTPTDMGMGEEINGLPLKSTISNLKIKFD